MKSLNLLLLIIYKIYENYVLFHFGVQKSAKRKQALGSETLEEKETRLAKKREGRAKAIENETLEETKARRAGIRSYDNRRRAVIRSHETFEDREVRRARKAIANRKAVNKKKEKIIPNVNLSLTLIYF